MINPPGSVQLDNANVVMSNRTILDNVSFRSEPGSIHCLIGPNGAGKSTLLLVLGADIAAGKLSLSGVDAASVSIPELARIRSFLRSNAKPNFPYSIFDVLSWSISSQGSADRDSLVQQALNAVGMHGMENHKITELSSGQLAKVNIAATILQSADIIFADEPEANLDPVARRQIWELLRDTKKTLVIATHDLEIVKEFATHVTALVGGQMVFSKAVADVTEQEMLEIYRG